HAFDVGTGAKGAAGAGDDDGPYRIVGFGALERGTDLVSHRWRDGVELVRAIEGDRRGVVTGLVEDGVVVRGHSSRQRPSKLGGVRDWNARSPSLKSELRDDSSSARASSSIA